MYCALVSFYLVGGELMSTLFSADKQNSNCLTTLLPVFIAPTDLYSKISEITLMGTEGIRTDKLYIDIHKHILDKQLREPSCTKLAKLLFSHV